MFLRISSFLFLFLSISTFLFSQNTSPVSDSVEASFPGGLPAWRKYLERNLKAEVPADNGAPYGYYTVRVKFVVAKDGSVSDIQALTNFGYGMEEEVVRIIKLSGTWMPGSFKGEPVITYHKQPVTFVLSGDDFSVKTKVPNKLFTGINNEITVSVSNEKNKDLTASITNGQLISFNGSRAIVNVTDTAKRAVLTIYSKKKKEKNMEVASYSFEVRPQHEALEAKKD